MNGVSFPSTLAKQTPPKQKDGDVNDIKKSTIPSYKLSYYNSILIKNSSTTYDFLTLPFRLTYSERREASVFTIFAFEHSRYVFHS